MHPLFATQLVVLQPPVPDNYAHKALDAPLYIITNYKLRIGAGIGLIHSPAGAERATVRLLIHLQARGR